LNAHAALKSVQKEKPAYAQGSHSWWTDVVKRTALGAGANPESKYYVFLRNVERRSALYSS
jgi:hypothetical protein